ncbi:hypothetical protein GQ44DRAFT_771634 [Phaeosphaeriaceae sp. PMI808]|nr:hypothetical protein GQ44DRAFT_771634 [Phaeosphaeriaceae sp. PMI808]
MDIYSHPNFQPFVDPASKDENTRFPLDGQDLWSVSDKTLIALYDIAPVVPRFEGAKIVLLSRTLALKGGSSVLPYEAANMNFAAAHANPST